MTRKVAVVANSDFPYDAATCTQVVEVLQGLPEDVLILTRGAQGFEQFIQTAALVLSRRCFQYPAKGGGDNLDRDSELVADADEVIAFLSPSHLDGKSGVAMVVEKALAAGKPVRAASAVEGTLVWA